MEIGRRADNNEGRKLRIMINRSRRKRKGEKCLWKSREEREGEKRAHKQMAKSTNFSRIIITT